MQSGELGRLLGTRTPPIAIAFRAEAPAGIAKVDKAEPAGCGYWRRAAAGEIFYTDAADHFGCPIGAHTHGVSAPPEVQAQLHGMLKMMVELEYLKMEEVPSIPARTEPFGVAMYAPLETAPFEADVVLVRGDARQLMLLQEAAQACGIASGGATLGRPTCAVLPQAMASGRSATSLACIGNRVYTVTPDGEAYVAIPADKIDEVTAKLAVLLRANEELRLFHQARRG